MTFWLLDETLLAWETDRPDYLNPLELPKLPGKRFVKRRVEWLHGRLAAKTLLQVRHPDCQNLPLSEILIENAPGGAPFATLVKGGPLSGSLSISHSGPLAASALALEAGVRVGIDLEKVELRPVSLFESYFTPAENAAIQNRPPEKLQMGVTLIWSAKEAVLKALQKGLALDTRDIEICLAGDTLNRETWNRFEVKVAGGAALNWAGWWRPWQDYVITLATVTSGQGLGGDVPLQVG